LSTIAAFRLQTMGLVTFFNPNQPWESADL
jgi:hypothetical protein